MAISSRIKQELGSAKLTSGTYSGKLYSCVREIIQLDMVIYITVHHLIIIITSLILPLMMDQM